MKTHAAAGAISVQVIEGEMEFTTNDQIIVLTAGQILVLQEGVPHSVLAKSQTVFLLTLVIS